MVRVGKEFFFWCRCQTDLATTIHCWFLRFFSVSKVHWPLLVSFFVAFCLCGKPSMVDSFGFFFFVQTAKQSIREALVNCSNNVLLRNVSLTKKECLKKLCQVRIKWMRTLRYSIMYFYLLISYGETPLTFHLPTQDTKYCLALSRESGELLWPSVAFLPLHTHEFPACKIKNSPFIEIAVKCFSWICEKSTELS